MAKGGNSTGPWEHALDLESLALPVSFTLFVGGLAGYFSPFGLIPFILLLFTAICLQMTANLARAYGDIVDRESVRREYYERKFAQYRMRRELDPVAATAGNMLAMQLRTMLVATSAMSLVLGYGFITASLGFGESSVAGPHAGQWLAFAVHAVVTALILLRYLGTWRHGYRVYGNIILFAIVGGCAVGCFYLLVHSLPLIAIYPSIGFAALAVALANMGDITRMETDASLRESSRARKTIPLALRFEGALMLQVAAVALAMIWLLSFPVIAGAAFIWNYAFLLFFIPLIAGLVSLRNMRPGDAGQALKSLAWATIALSIAWILSLAVANLGPGFLQMVA